MRVYARLLPYLVALWVVLATQPPLRAAALKGLVLLNRLGGPPLDGVRVNASGANQWVIKEGGRFELEFPGKKAGDTVTLTIALAGYEVVNDLQREAVLPSDPDNKQLTFLLAKAADRDEMARSYYRLKSTEAVAAAYEVRLRVLEKTQRNTAEELAVLRTERDRALQAADRAAEELAKTKLEDASELYKEALRFSLDGQVEQALEVLDEAKLRAMAQAAQERRAAADRQLSAASQAYRLRGQLLTSQLQFADAEKAYRAAVDATPDDFDANFELAYFSQTVNHFEDAITFYTKAERISRPLASGNPPVYRPYVAMTLNNLGNLYSDETRMEEARKAYEEALEIRRDLARQNPAVYRPKVADTLNNLGILYSDENRTEEARKAYAEALEIYRDLARQNPAVYRPDVATTLNNLGVLYSDENRMEEASKALEEALEIRRDLARQNPALYRPDVATTLNNLGILYSDENRMEEARKAYEEALEIYRDLARQNPAVYRPYVATTLNNLGHLYIDENRMEEARKALEEALEIRRDLARQNPAVYRPYVAMTLNNLGVLYRDENRMEEARKAYEEALQIYQAFAHSDPSKYQPDVLRVGRLLDELSAPQVK